LWTWGSNQQSRAGLGPNLDKIYVPTKVTSFETLKIQALKVSSGRNHTLVLAKEQNGDVRLYSIGQDEKNFKNLGCTAEQASESTIRKIHHFQDFEIQDFSACT
jgi:alpha-tubulin suppressor-like RCC1 family protein